MTPLSSRTTTGDGLVPTPPWADGLIIYEIATKAYTSPRGPESGTFDSLREKIPYLRDLGITAIWLTGHSLSDPAHFYNIWTQYACMRPEQLDPTLGGEASFRALIDAAHQAGIRVFLDVITHGVITGSPLIAEHPHWFKGGTWGMTDYDWYGGHADLDEWWVDTWVRYVEQFGIDGFRLDVATYRFDLWARIRRRCTTHGHPIVIIAEVGPGMAGVTDFLQHAVMLANTRTGQLDNQGILADAATYLADLAGAAPAEYTATVTYDDGTTASSAPGGALRLSPGQAGVQRVEVGEGVAYLRHTVELALEGVQPGKGIAQIDVRGAGHRAWQLHPTMLVDYALVATGDPPALRLSFQQHLPPGQLVSVQLSCHDNGWEGFPAEQSPYVARGSRFLLGYTTLLAPGVPVLMAGEEFAADYRPLPHLSPRLFGGADPGKGRWLYGSWIAWEQLDEPACAAVLDDTRRLVRIRREAGDLIRPLRVGQTGEGGPLPVQATSTDQLPVPYLYHGGGSLLLVAGNPHPDRDVRARFQLPSEATGTAPGGSLRVVDLWTDQPARTLTMTAFEQEEWTIPRDKTPRGGLLVLRLELLQAR